MINWSKLRTYNQDVHLSFEELCYQVAKLLHGAQGQFTRIDGSGGDNGVEFYLTLDDGSQWGWQARFYTGSARLSVSSRKPKIKSSLAKACSEHPQMVKWVFCTPTNFTEEENNWFERTLPGSVPHGMCVQLEHWGASEFSNWMSQPRFSGKRQYFFGELELSIDWFRAQFNKEVAGIGGKYEPLVHTETGIERVIHDMLGDGDVIGYINGVLTTLNAKMRVYQETLLRLSSTSQKVGQLDEVEREILEKGETFNNTLGAAAASLETGHKNLIAGNIEGVQSANWADIRLMVENALRGLLAFQQEIKAGNAANGAGMHDSTEAHENQARLIDDIPLIASSCFEEVFDAVQMLEPIAEADIHILGKAGVGKTHMVTHLCDERIAAGLPAILLRGIRFASNASSVEAQLRSLLDIATCYSWDDFLGALSSAAEAYHVRIPLVIDGLNEAAFVHAGSSIWTTELPRLVQHVSEYRSILLVTTCRDTYRDAFWPGGLPQNSLQAQGFDEDELPLAFDKYLEHFKIKVDGPAAHMSQFRHPILLRMFCECINADRQCQKSVRAAEYSLYRVFETYLEKTDREVCLRLGLHLNSGFLSTSLEKIADWLWENKSRSIPLSDLTLLLDGALLTDLDWWRSKTSAVLEDGLLICRTASSSGEIVYFTYDLFGGYLIAASMLQHHAKDLREFVNSIATTMALFEKNGQVLHPLADDISRCLAALLPPHTSHYLHDLTDNDIALDVSVAALFELSTQFINRQCTNLVTRIFADTEKRAWLLEKATSTWCQPNHPFNGVFWSDLLMQLPMPERDLSWTEHVRANRHDYEITVERFRDICERHNVEQISEEAWLPLGARQALWILTSTVRPLRDKATRALYWYGRQLPEDFLVLLKDAMEIDDPYISERMLAAAYGVAMARQFDFDDPSFTDSILPNFARLIYDQMFAVGSPHSTTHILARDYARRLIVAANNHHPNLLSLHETMRITPPFHDGGIRSWGHRGDEEEEPEETIEPLQTDFANYTLGTLVEGRSNYDFDNPEYKIVRGNVLWRIYQLGYSSQRFGDIDRAIARRQWQSTESEDGRRTERYGKKYSWIAYYELAGFREDNRSPSDLSRVGRIWDVDIDPSFPIELQQLRHIQSDYLGDRVAPVEEWIEEGDIPDLQPYFVVDELIGHQGPWVLLDGYVTQEDNDANRRLFIFPRSFVVKKGHANRFATWLAAQSLGGRWLPEVIEDYLTYAGEIPWSDTFPTNGLTTVERLPRGSPAMQPTVGDRSTGFQVLIPVRKNCWEQQHSVIAPHRNVTVPAREIADCLDLCGQPQTFDLFERSGQRASVSFSYGDLWHSGHKLVYLRSDLLDRFLSETGNSLVWAIWGERGFYSRDYHAIESFSAGHPPNKVFQLIRTYAPKRKKSK